MGKENNMPSGIYEHKKGRKGFWKGKKRPNYSGKNHPLFGKHHSEETKEKNRKSHLGKKYKPMSAEGKENIRKAHLGYRLKEETKKKISEALKGHKMPDHVKKMVSERIIGNKNPQWKGGVTTENRKIRKSIEFRLWRESVFARDNWTCQKTKVKGGKLHPHHIKNLADNPEFKFAIDNGVTLSAESHEDFHKIYGRKHNTKEQLEEFLRT